MTLLQLQFLTLHVCHESLTFQGQSCWGDEIPSATPLHRHTSNGRISSVSRRCSYDLETSAPASMEIGTARAIGFAVGGFVFLRTSSRVLRTGFRNLVSGPLLGLLPCSN